MLGKIKDSSARSAGSNDGIRLFNKAIELLSSTTPESEHELLELVKKAKRERDVEREPSDTSKKTTAGRGYGEFSDLSAYGHRTILVPMPGHVGVQPTNSNVETGALNSGNSALGSTSASSGHAQSRLIHAARSGSSKSHAEKPKRKLAR